MSDIQTLKKKKFWFFFFSGTESVTLHLLAPQVPPISCQNLNPGSLIHDHVSFPLCLSTDILNIDFWEIDSQLNSLGLSICVHIPNGYHVLICSQLLSLFRDSCLIFLEVGICSFGFSWQRDLSLVLCLLPLAFSLCSGMFFFPETCLHLSCLGELCDFSHPLPSESTESLIWLGSAWVTDTGRNGLEGRFLRNLAPDVLFFFFPLSLSKYLS